MIHQAVFAIATIWIAILLGICVVLVIRAKLPLARVLAFDLVTIVVVALLVLLSNDRQVSYYLDAALVMALLSFVGTIAAARFHSEGKIFS